MSENYKKYSELIFMHENKRKEWEQTDPRIKSMVVKHLEKTAQEMENHHAIQMLCHVINDMNVRIEFLEGLHEGIKQ
jgi:hypothetical protein